MEQGCHPGAGSSITDGLVPTPHDALSPGVLSSLGPVQGVLMQPSPRLPENTNIPGDPPWPSKALGSQAGCLAVDSMSRNSQFVGAFSKRGRESRLASNPWSYHPHGRFTHRQLQRERPLIFHAFPRWVRRLRNPECSTGLPPTEGRRSLASLMGPQCCPS